MYLSPSIPRTVCDPPFPLPLPPHLSYILSHSFCDTSLPKSPTTIVDPTHLTSIRNYIINPLLACHLFSLIFPSHFPILAKVKCMLLAFVMYLLPHHPFYSLNSDLCHYLPKYWNQTDRYNKMRHIQPLHSSIAAEILLIKYENKGCPEQPGRTELLGFVFARTSISALRRECSMWASSFLK